MSVEETVVLNPLCGDRTVPCDTQRAHNLPDEDGLKNKKDMAEGQSRFRVLLWISLIFFFIFTPFFGSEALQSTIHPVHDLGILNYGIMYGSFTFSSAFLASAGVRFLTPKWTLVVAWFFYCLHVAANFYPRMWTLLPAGSFSGAMGGLVWVAQGIYVTRFAVEHAQFTGSDIKPVLGYFNGIFYGSFSLTHIMGNLIPSLIFGAHGNMKSNETHDGKSNGDSITSTIVPEINYNSTSVRDHIAFRNIDSSHTLGFLSHEKENLTSLKNFTCGANFCPADSSTIANLEIPPKEVVYTIMAAYVLCNVIGHIMTCFLPNVRAPTHEKGSESSFKHILSTVTFLKNYKLLMLLPSLIEVGAFPGVAVGSFTQAFISCSLGVDWVSLVMLCRGSCFALGCFISGSLLKWVSRPVIYTITLALHCSTVLSWLLWTPSSDTVWPFFVISSMEGAASGSIRVQCGALVGLCFPDKLREAFSHQSVWNGVGLTLSFLIGRSLCFSTKAYALLILVTCSFICYIILEVIIDRESKNSKTRLSTSVVITSQEQKGLTSEK